MIQHLSHTITFIKPQVHWSSYSWPSNTYSGYVSTSQQIQETMNRHLEQRVMTLSSETTLGTPDKTTALQSLLFIIIFTVFAGVICMIFVAGGLIIYRSKQRKRKEVAKAGADMSASGGQDGKIMRWKQNAQSVSNPPSVLQSDSQSTVSNVDMYGIEITPNLPKYGQRSLNLDELKVVSGRNDAMVRNEQTVGCNNPSSVTNRAAEGSWDESDDANGERMLNAQQDMVANLN